jgi:M6 family metalloprotease-like protein
MRLRTATPLVLIFSLLFPATLFAANPKTGASCSKAGLTQTYSGKKFTCIKSGKKLVWDRGIIVVAAKPKESEKFSPSNSSTASPSPSVTPTKFDWSKTYSTDSGYFHSFNGPCQFDNDIEKQWLDLQSAYYANGKCAGIYGIAKYALGLSRPTTQLNIEKSLPVEQCKIAEPTNSMALRGFNSKWDSNRIKWTNNHKIPRSNMTIQLIPIFADDTAKPVNSPEQDYGKYLKVLKDWVEYSSDVESSVQVRIPDKYLEFNGKLGSYSIYHENRHDNTEHVRFNKDLVAQVDSQIDFTGVDAAIIVVPAGTDLSTFQQGTIGELNTKEGMVYVSTTEYPYTLKDLRSVKFTNFLIPFWWIHELFHSGVGYTDHYGDGQQNTKTDYGMGWWSLMTPWGGDLSAWEKWALSFYADSQINCLEKNSTNIFWLAPSSVETSEKKLTIIPISEFKAIAIESIRPAGLYYKIPKESQGVLVYEIDLTVTNYDSGLTLVLPTNRDPNKGPFFMAQAPLRKGESVVSNGQRITIVESGTFGDVVKVEKA